MIAGREIPREYHHPYRRRLLRSFPNPFYLIPSLSSRYHPFANVSFSNYLGSLSSLLLLRLLPKKLLIEKLVVIQAVSAKEGEL